MRVQVNLASRPFVELRPFFLRLRVIMASLVVFAIGLGIGAHILQKRLNVARATMDRLEHQTAVAQGEKAGNERRMRQPENAAVLERAHFLNALFLRKSFSWTAVMMDLETVLPTGVQITAIEPQIAADGDVTIRMRVGGDRDRAIQLVRNLERSQRFLQPQLTGEAPQAKEAAQQQNPNGPPPGVEFEILARYNPLPADQPLPTDADAKSAATKPAPKTTPAAPKTPPAKRPAPKTVIPPARPGAPAAPAKPKPQLNTPKGATR